MFLKQPWRRQLPLPLPIDWSHPLSKGLIFAVMPAGKNWLNVVNGELGQVETMQLVHRVQPNKGGMSREPHAYGIASTGTVAVDVGRVRWSVKAMQGNAFQTTGTMLALGCVVGATDSLYSFGGVIEDVNGHGPGLAVDDNIQRLLGRGVLRMNFGSVIGESDQNALPDPHNNKLHFFGYGWEASGATGDFFYNGRNEGWTAGTTFGATTAGRYFAVYDHASGAYGPDVFLALFLLWNRRLLQPEYRQLYNEGPWQLFQPQQRKLYVAAAAAGITGTVAATEGNDTSSASGTVTVTGTAAASEAQDSGAASGLVTVTGTSAATEGDDTASGTGAIGDAVVGTVAVTEEDDVASATGEVAAPPLVEQPSEHPGSGRLWKREDDPELAEIVRKQWELLEARRKQQPPADEDVAEFVPAPAPVDAGGAAASEPQAEAAAPVREPVELAIDLDAIVARRMLHQIVNDAERMAKLRAVVEEVQEEEIATVLAVAVAVALEDDY